MTRHRRLLAGVLMAVLAFGAVACDGGGDDDDDLTSSVAAE